MSKEKKSNNKVPEADGQPGNAEKLDSLGSTADVLSHDVPTGVDRRDFLIRSAVVGAAAVMTGRSVSAAERNYEAVR